MRPIALLVLVAIVAVAACRDWNRFAADPSTGGEAPQGGGGSGGSISDGGMGTGASGGGTGGSGNGGPVACASIEMVADDFESGGIDGDVFDFGSDTGASVSPSGGQLTFTGPDGFDGAAWFSSRFAYDLTAATVSVELTAPAGPGSHGLWFELKNGDTWFEFWQGGDVLGVNTSDSGTIHSEPFDPVAHRFLQFREQDGTVYWEVSSDGAAWQPFFELPVAVLFDIRHTHVGLGYYSDDGGSYAVDNLNGGQPAVAPWCPVATLQDDFSGAFDAAWTGGFAETDCGAYAGGDVIHIDFQIGAYGLCIRASSRPYDVRGEPIELEIVNAPESGDNARMVLGFVDVGDSGAGWAISDGMLQYLLVDAGGIAVLDIEPWSDGWLRLTEDQGRIHIDGSSDGQSWQPKFDIDAPASFDPERAVVFIGGETTVSTPIYLDYHADNLNLP